MYKISLTKLMYKIHNNLTPDAMSAIITNNDNIKRYQLRKKLKIDVPHFNTNYMRNSVARRGAIVWLKGSAKPSFPVYLPSNINQKGGRFKYN